MQDTIITKGGEVYTSLVLYKEEVKMDIESLINLAVNNCFAIVFCILMFKRMSEQDDKMTTIVINNTKSITKLCEKIDRLIDKEM